MKIGNVTVVGDPAGILEEIGVKWVCQEPDCGERLLSCPLTGTTCCPICSGPHTHDWELVQLARLFPEPGQALEPAKRHEILAHPRAFRHIRCWTVVIQMAEPSEELLGRITEAMSDFDRTEGRGLFAFHCTGREAQRAIQVVQDRCGDDLRSGAMRIRKEPSELRLVEGDSRR